MLNNGSAVSKLLTVAVLMVLVSFGLIVLPGTTLTPYLLLIITTAKWLKMEHTTSCLLSFSLVSH